ncbi:hypothetical protein WH47_05192, partial [Habropoda laboriosa]
RISPAECVQKRRSSTCTQKRVSSVKRNSARNNEKHAKCQMITEPGISVEKEPRSYAQMIARYNEMMYAQNSSGILRDNLSSAMINGIRRSPFSSASVVSLKWKCKPKSSRNTTSLNHYSQNAKFSSDTSTAHHSTSYNNKNLTNTIGENNHLLDNTSYATMIEKYSSRLHLGVDSCMIHKRNVSTNLDGVSAILMDAKSTSNKLTGFSSGNGSGKSSTRSTEVKRIDETTDDQDGWITKVDGIIKDLKRITAKNESIESKSNDKWMLQSVNEHAHWLDRVITAHKKKIKDNKPTMEKGATTIIPSEAIQLQESPTPDNRETVNTTLTPNDDHRAERQTMHTMNRDKPSNPMVEYIKRGPVSSTTRNTSQSPTSVATSSTKEPQIELRMTPSQNESVVSINVDELEAKTAGAKEQLSVIISSKRDKAGKVDTANARSDFASMHISISENTIPVKQIEFSINGKPVSELKSIVARADKLDVLGSMDKVEIRIPSKDSASKQQTKTVGSSTTSPVLNLQIAAKFNEPQYQQPRNANLKDTSQMPPPAPPPTPKPPMPHIPSKPRTHNIFTPDTTKSGVTKVEAGKNEETKVAKDVNFLKMRNERSENVGTREVDTFTAKPNEAVFQRSDMNVPSSNHSRQPSINNQNQTNNSSPENRTPSNIIPWWSSEDSFKKIRKKGNTPKSALAAFTEPVIESQVNDNVNTMPKIAQNLTPDATLNQQPNSVDIKKTDTSSGDQKHVAAKKPIVDEKMKSPDMSDTLARSVRVKSPQKWKANSGTKYAKIKSGTNSNRVVKRMKYRLKSNLNTRKSSVSVKKEPDATTFPVSSPKEVKYIAVDPETGSLGMKPEVEVSPSNTKVSPPNTKVSSSNTKVIADDKQKMAQKTNDAKLGQGESKVETKIEKPAVVQVADPQAGKAKDTVLKEEKSLGGRANKFADVSAKATPSVSKHGLGTDKEGKQRETDGSGERNLPNEPVNKDQRIKEILKSMKPIEKRKDGTLIDYGVMVPSRKPSEKIKQIARIPSKEPSENIVEAKKVSTTKKQVPIEPKNVSNKSKIVEPVKKPIEVSNRQTKPEIKNVSKPDVKLSTGKVETEKKPLTTTKMDNSKVRKSITSSSSDSKINVSKSPIKQNPRAVASANTKKTPHTGAIPKKTGEIKIKPATEKSRNILYGETARKMEGSKDTLKPAEKKESLQGTIVPPSKDTLKATEKKKKLDEVIVPPPKDTLKPAEKKESLQGTIVPPSKDTLKATEKKKNDAPLKAPVAPLGKKESTTGVAPLRDTIDYQLSKDQNTSAGLTGIGEEKKVTSEMSERNKKDPLKSNVAKKPSNKGGSNTGSGGPVGTPTGPAGSKDTETPTTFSKRAFDKTSHDETSRFVEKSDAYVLLSREVDRPEKTILYTSWLQRFKDRIDDGKTI